jgi:hypothetical protein
VDLARWVALLTCCWRKAEDAGGRGGWAHGLGATNCSGTRPLPPDQGKGGRIGLSAFRDANEFSYTIDRATLDLDGSVFSVKVSNALYSTTTTSREAVLHVVPDVNAPALVSVEAINGLTLRPTFDERLDPNSAVALLLHASDPFGGALLRNANRAMSHLHPQVVEVLSQLGRAQDVVGPEGVSSMS